MSKMTEALRKASEQRAQQDISSNEHEDLPAPTQKEGTMSKAFTWVFFIAAVVVVFIAFNYQSGQDAVPLSEIFPDQVEYEFVQEEAVSTKKPSEVTQVSVVTESEPIAKVEKTVSQVNQEELSFSSSPVTTNKDFNFTVQIASFKDEKRAEEALKRIRAKVPTAYISTQDLGAKGVWHRVYAGQYQLRNDAEVALHGIKKNYDSSFIISPKKAK